MGRGGRPELVAPPEVYYNDDEAQKYTNNSRIINIQTALTERALELLNLPKDSQPKMILDLGCGSGLSGEVLTEHGHIWMGFDISESMLDVALEREVEGDLCLHDLGHGMPLRPGMFDGAISISAVQWLCNADKTCNEPKRRMKRFFETLYSCLSRGARAVLQIYPETHSQAEMLVTAAMKVGFSGGLVVDFPHSTRAKKHFLVLMVGSNMAIPQAKGLNGEDEEMAEDEESEDDEEEATQIKVMGRERLRRRAMGKKDKNRKGKDWVVRKKEQMRKKGREVANDSKYTARRRKKIL